MSREYSNLNEVLRWKAEHSSSQPAFTFLKDNGEEEAQWSYAELDHAARAIAGRLQQSVAIGQRILLLFPPSLEFVAAFWGCLYAGAIAVPAYPVRSQANVRRLKKIVEDCQPSAVLTTRRGRLRMKDSIDSELAALPWIETDSLSGELAEAWQEPQISRDSIALLQYTSGSTGEPKGVVVSHGNLLHNEEIIQSTFRQSQDSVIVGWLPLYHDMGLMGTMLQPVYAGAWCILMSPNAFLQRPFRWLEAISRYRATTSGGPNFAYELCVRKITEEERATLDLSSWTVAFNGAETVRAETLERFAARFAAVGFSRKSFRPCYGLAEATLLVSAQSRKQPARHLTIDADKLGHNQVKVVAAGAGAIDVVSCGRTADGHQAAIVDPETLRRLAPNQIGEIWVAGPSVAQGYWNRPEETARLFAARTRDTGEGPFLRTGDLGFIKNGSLFITGRSKDLIIIRGRNHYPQDIEVTVQAAHAALKPGLGATFSVAGEEGEHLVVLHEVEHAKERQLSGVIDAIRQAIAEQHEIQAQAVVLLRSGTIPRTSSGKIQRYLCRDLFLQEKLSPLAEWRAGTRAAIASSGQPVVHSGEGIEQWLAEKFAAWTGVARENIQVHEPISRYGLDSLAAVELSHAAERELGLSLPLSSLLQGKSIVELTRELMNGQPAGEELPAELKAGNVLEEVALSEGQRSLWYLHQLAPESAAYNLAFVARVVNGADTRVLGRIFQVLAQRHSALRTTFHTNHAGEPFQRIHPLPNASVVEVDAAGWSDSVLEQHFQEEADRHFNLELGPLWRVTLFHRADGECFIAITLHHIIGDLWSVAMLLDEMGRLYAAETKGEKLALPPVESSYSHFVLWQRKMLSSAEGARLNAYWTSQLEGELPVLELATDRVRPTMQTYRGAAKTFALDAQLSQGLRNLCHDNQTTFNVILLAAFQVLLHRHSGQRDLLVGSPAANRTHASWANVFGYFVNPVVLRSKLESNLPFDEFLAQTHTTMVEALEHQHYPFSTLVQKLQPQRDPSRSPLFQAMFVFEKTRFLEQAGIGAFALGGKGTRLEFAGLTLESASPASTKALFDLMLRVAEAGQETRCCFEYNTDLFDAETIHRMAEQWRQLLQAIVARQTTPVRDLPLLKDAERKQMLEEWNRTEREYPQRWMHQLLEDQVKRTPEAVAVEYEDQQLKYEELNRRSNQLAHYLRSLGVGPEVRVGICLERSLEMVVGLLGVLKAGGAYVPLDPAYPAERLLYMLEDTQAPVLLTQSEPAATVAGYGGKIVELDREWQKIASYSAANPVCEVSGENLAYVIYTSGSTGWPKGVGIRHSSAMVLLQWGREVFSDEELSGVLAATSICFDLSVFEIFVPLSWGGKAIIAANALELPRIAGREQVKLVNTVPSVMKDLVRREAVPRSVVTVNLAGEALLADLVREVYGSQGVRRVLNLYGPSEDTTYSTWAWIAQEAACAGEKAGVSIGKPVANTGVYVLEEELQPAPVGVAGELYIGGAGLARGYVNQPGLTAERFVPHPFASCGGKRLYRTGDRARWRRDGNLEYLGRLDQQVKIRGYRIELGEIEAALQKQAGVREAVVVAREDVPGEKRLVAYVVGAVKEVKEEGSGQVKLEGSELRRQLRGHLPEYMVPSAYVQMDELPLNANGKLDRKALPAPQAVEAGAQDRKPRTVEEEILCGIWSEVLKVDRIGLEDNFFMLGGHSLLATQVISRTRSALGVELPLRDLFETDTLAEFAAEVERALKTEGKAEIPAIVPLPREGTFPLSFAEQRLWFVQQMQPASTAYNCPIMLRLSGELDQEELARSLQGLVMRHEMLRTTFPSDDGSPVQKINQDMVLQLPVTDLESLPDEEKEKMVEQFAAEEANTPFDLATGPLFRVQLLRLNRQQHVLLATMHHIITDAWSNGILIREFVELYTAQCQGRAPQLEELSLHYADFAVWQRNWLRDEVLKKQLEFWKKQLEGAATLALPHDYPRPSQPTHEGALMQCTVALDVLDKLKQLSRQEGVTLFMTLMAAFQLLVARYAEQDDIVVATPIANRSQRFMESLVGFFVNALVVRTDLGGDPAFVELLARVRKTMLDVYDHQDVPFEKVIDHLLSDRDSTRSPFLDITFVLQNVQTEKFALPGLELKQCVPRNMPSKVDISLAIEESHESLNALLHYSTELFSAESMARFLQHYVALLSGIAQDSQRNISEFSLLTPTEEQEVLIKWNDTTTPYPSTTADLLYRAHAERKGGAPAVVFNGTTLTYEQLDQETNQLARYLQKLGVGPETRVGLYVDRGLAIARGVLGIWKAGGAYLPLDPSYPSERLAYMVEDAQVGIILTQESLRADSPFQHTFDIYLDSDWPQIAQESTGALLSNINPLNAAYVIYTSGSTGKPKGTTLTHQGLCNLAHAQQDIFQLPDHSAVLQFASFSFDAATWEISMSLLAGHRLVVAPRDQLLPDVELLKLIRQNEVTAVTLPPSVLAALPQEELPGLQTLVLAGEACGQELVNKWSHGRKMFDAYGPTETTVCATISAPLNHNDRQAPSIGRPLPNMRVYLLDQDLRPSPVGIAGELYVGGTGLARDYLNRPDLTAERFVPNPYPQSRGERLYKTGDRARWRANGQLEFLGRRDAQVKVRGFRIELEEIEAVLKQYASIQQAAVVVQERANGDKRIVGFVVLQRPDQSHVEHSSQSNGHHVPHQEQTTSEPLDLAAIKKDLLAQLPEHMVPSVLIEVDKLPITPNGKTDRKALAERPDEEETIAVENVQQERPMTTVEEIVAAIWMDVLGVKQVKAEQNFFEIGGHSLLATQVISRIREAFGIDLELNVLFENPHLHRLAAVIEETRQETARVPMQLIQRTDRSKDMPLSFAQQRLWFIDQMEPGNPAYNASFGVRLSGELNYDAVRESLASIVQRHEILRTCFQMIGGEPRQIIWPVENVAFRLIDLSGTDPEKWEAEGRRLAHHEYNTRFDLTQGPLMRTVLVKLDKHEHLLLTTMHHIVGDGWSMAILVREFSKAYEARCQAKKIQLEELPIQYADFAVWQRHWLQGETLKEQLEYWKAQLAGAPVLELPTDKPRPAVASHRGQSVAFELSPDLTEKLLALARRESVTPFMLLLAAYEVLLCRYTEQEDIVVGTPIANRNRAEIEPLIGFFINHIALRSKIRRDEGFSELLATVRAVSLGAYAHQDLPFEKLVEELSPERTLSHAPLFQVVFALQNVPYEEIHLPGLTLATFAPEREFEKAEMSLVMEERAGVLKGELGYATDLFEKSTIERFIGHFCRVLEDVAQDPSKSIEDLVLLTDAEREQLLESWNPPRVPQPAQAECWHELFEAQVKRIPEATAVVYEDRELTYAELNQKANQLARYLRSLGIERELRVGIFLERSLETIVAVLGILKAGAAYVPLDAGLPTERLAQMIEDVQAAVLITGEKLRDKLPSVWAQVISIDQDWETIAQEEANNLEVSVSHDCLAYVIFTSGSTGKPKAVGIEHRQICSYTNAVANRLQMQEGWSYALISTFAADLGNTMLFPSLGVGGTLHVIAEDRSRDGSAMTRYVQEHGVLDCLKITPTQLRVLVESGGSSVVPAKRLVVGGEATTWEWAQEWQSIRPECQIWNHYGPTESTVGVCTFDISRALASSAPEPGSILLGKPLPHSRLYVLDEVGELAPVGVPGELYIGGEGVGRGYLNSSAATAEKFVPDPFVGSGSRLYRSGDRVRWTGDGNLEFLGRKDKQVKVRGYRIELGEIESVLNQHSGVRQGAVVLREDEPGEKQLVAYVVPRWRDDHWPQDASHYRLGNGLRVAHQNKNETEYLYREIFENQVYFQHGIELPQDACVLDIGANIGMFSLFVGKSCPQGRIYAFEPISSIFECLKSNIGLIGAQRTKIFPIGLSNEEKTAEFTYYPRYSMMSGLSCYSDADLELETVRQTLRNQKEAGDDSAVELLASIEDLLAGRFEASHETCQLRRLSDVIEEEGLERIDLLKVDAQRAELDVLLGIDDRDWRKIQQVVMEVHDGPGLKTEGQLEKVLSLLESQGFYASAEQYGELRGTDRWNLYASRKKEEDRDPQLAPATVAAKNPEPVAVTSSELRTYLAEKLPEYMVPAALVMLDELPLLSNGKLDYKALPRPQERESLENYKQPRTPIEEILAGIWSEVLKVDQVGVDDNFFVLGGHSLLATQVISRAQAALGTELSLRMLFEEPTIAGFAACVERAKKQSALPLSPIARVSRELPLPLSFGQQRLWFLQQLDPESCLYNLPYALRLTGSLDQSALGSAFGEIVRRHEILRTRYEVVGGEAVQCIDPASAVPIEQVDLRGVAEPEAEALALAEKYAREAFDLSRGPLMRVRLLQLGDHDYVLCLVLHHISSDGWSLDILVREFMELYRACHEGRPARLEELPLQYADYAVWQREWLGQGELQEQMGYWKQQLAGLEKLELPTDHPRPAVMSHRGAMVGVEWGEELTGRIREMCRREGVTLFMALLAAVQVLLERYAGQQEVAVGTPIANRTRQEIEPLIGFFVNTLVLRGEVRKEWSWREMLKRVREVTLAAYAHQDLPFEQLVEELQPVRDLSRNPLFDVWLLVQNDPQESFSLPGLSVETLGTEEEVAKFDLAFSAVESAGKIRVGINYATELYEQATIDRMAEHFRAVVEEMTRNAESRIGEVSILSDAERAELEGWNRTEREYPQRWVHELFEDQAARTPEAIAVEYEDERLNYHDLNRRSNQLAHYLRNLGVGPEVRVALCMERSLEMVISILAVLKAGGAYVPLDPSYPAERLSYMLEGGAAGVLLGQARLQEKWLSYMCVTIQVDTEWETIEQYSDTNLRSEVSGENLAYVIYTSGSTGKPKGIEISHHSLANHMQWMQEEFHYGPQDRILQKTSTSFDASVWEFYAPLLTGGQLVLLREGDQRDPECLTRQITKAGITVVQMVPSLLEAVLQTLPTSKGESIEPNHLRLVMCGGEVLKPEPASAVRKQWRAEVVNLYGPTECTIDATFWRAGMEWEEERIPIGKPVANMQVYVLDDAMEAAPIGVAGELYIGGAGLARGYLDEPGLTAEGFVPNPFANCGGERLYRTGDRARWRSDGNLEYLGRLDQQVKIRGYRIELGEIESVLHGLAGVKQAVVTVREDEPGDKRLVAHVVGKVKEEGSGQVELQGSELRRQLQGRLPEYMVPSAYVQIEEMPLTGNGKVDRKRLPQPERGSQEAGYQAPQGEVEQTLADIWKQVLRLERVGREDNFFELGGDSILSIKVATRAAEAGLEVTVPQMFEQQRLRELAGVVGQRGKTPEVRGEEEEVRGELELTAIQRWFFERELEAKQHFNQALLLSVRSGADGKRLGEVVESVLKHHDAVRLRFWQEAGRWKQRYGEDRELEGIYTRIDLRGVEREKRKERMEEICGELQRSLNLERGPLARVAYFELGEGESGRLFWVMHHLIVDGVSWRILLEDVHTAWEQLGREVEVKLPGKTASLQKWVAGLKEWVESGELEEEERGYWLSLKARAKGELPRDYEGGRGTVADNEQVVRELGEKETGVLLREAPRRYQVQIQEALLTALVDAVGEWTGEDGVLVEMEGHGREAVPGGVNVTRTVGWFTTQFPVWLGARRGMDVERRMEGVRRTLTQVPRHGIGYGLLRYFGKEELRKKLSEVPQAEISFNYLGQLDEALPEESLFTAGEEQRGQDERQKRSHALGLVASISHGKLRVVLNYSRKAHRRETVENLAASLMATLNEVASLCQNPNGVSERRASPEVQLSDAEMRKLLSTVSVYRPTVRK